MLRSVLVYLHRDGHEADHVATAADLASAHEAHLTGLAVAEPLAAHAEYLPPEALDRYREAWQTRNAELARVFNETAAHYSLVTEWRSVEDLRVDRGTLDIIAQHTLTIAIGGDDIGTGKI